MPRHNQSGFSLPEVIISLALFGVVSVALMQLSGHFFKSDTTLKGVSSKMLLKNFVSFYLSRNAICRTNFAAHPFHVSQLAHAPLSFELWSVDQANLQSRKLLSATDASKLKFGQLILDTIDFSVPNYTADLPNSSQGWVMGQLLIKGREEGPAGKAFGPIIIPLEMKLKTDGAGLSTVIDCSSIKTFVKNRWKTVGMDYTAKAGDSILMDTSIGSHIFKLPPNPQLGDEVRLLDKLGTFKTAPVTVDMNGKLIYGLADQVVGDVSDLTMSFVYSGDTNGWILR